MTTVEEHSSQSLNRDTESIQGKGQNFCNNNVETTKENVMDLKVPTEIVWRSVAILGYIHVAAIYGLYLFVTGQVMWQTFVLGTVYYAVSGLGGSAASHRYWAHKSYKAKLPLRILLTIFQTITCQNSIYVWSRDHRVHHKYSETNADPHNAKRGLFFAHMGWLMVKKHPAVKVKGAEIDLSDLESDAIVSFQKKYYLQLIFFLSFFLPTLVAMTFWNESFTSAWFFVTQFRLCVTLHATWLVNSAAHLWGNRPYDKTINPAENKLASIFTMGDGWHNFHHTFPWDYKSAEMGNHPYSLATAFINLMAAIGWAYDLKTVPKNLVAQRIARTGDGSHVSQQHDNAHDHVHEEGAPWGWGDKDIPIGDADFTQTLHRLSAKIQ